MLNGGDPVVAITAGALHFANGLTYRRSAWPPGPAPVRVWQFGERGSGA